MTTVVVGAGQAGLAVSHELVRAGVDHEVLEQHRVGEAWRRRWDSFSLVTPNWTLRLPDSAYEGEDPEGHVDRASIVRFLQDYADHQVGPIHEDVQVHELTRGMAARFDVRTSFGEIEADTVVVCTGAFQRPLRPEVVDGLPAGLPVLDASSYRRPGDLPEGRILIVGSGQTGVQLAEELHEAGRDVVLACGRAPWLPRRLDGLDIVTWLERTDFFEQTLADLPSPAARLAANAQLTGADGGHDLDCRVLQAKGVTLAGHLAGVSDERVTFADDLAESVAWGDAAWADIRGLLQAQLGGDAPTMPEPEPFVADAPVEARTSDFAAVILAVGFRPDYARWVRLPVFDERGFPVAREDLSTAVPGLYFCGVHFLRNRRSSLMWGVGDDARIVVEAITRDRASRRESA